MQSRPLRSNARRSRRSSPWIPRVRTRKATSDGYRQVHAGQVDEWLEPEAARHAPLARARQDWSLLREGRQRRDPRDAREGLPPGTDRWLKPKKSEERPILPS